MVQNSPSTSRDAVSVPSVSCGLDMASSSISNPMVQTETDKPSSTTFAELLLATVRGQPTQPSGKKRRVARGAEVITSADVVKRLREEKEENEKKEKDKEERQKEKEREKRENLSKEEKKEKHEKKVKEPKKKKICKGNLSDSEEEVCNNVVFQSSDEENIVDLIEEENRFQNETEALCEGPHNWKVQDWALIKFAGKTSVKHFIGLIESVSSNNEPSIRFVRKVNCTSKLTTMKYPGIEDVSEVTDDQIISILPPPSLGRRGESVFNIGFSQYNIQ